MGSGAGAGGADAGGGGGGGGGGSLCFAGGGGSGGTNGSSGGNGAFAAAAEPGNTGSATLLSGNGGFAAEEPAEAARMWGAEASAEAEAADRGGWRLGRIWRRRRRRAEELVVWRVSGGADIGGDGAALGGAIFVIIQMLCIQWEFTWRGERI